MDDRGPGFDLLIRNATLVDGTGAPARRADVAILGDRIAAVGALAAARAARSIDGEGLVLAPGFIDVHSHDDRAVLARQTTLPKLSQGVTTVVVGNCGISLAPLSPQAEPPAPLNLLGDRAAFHFPTFASYVQALEAAPLAVNVVALVGHGTLRVARMGDWTGPAGPAEIAAMAEEVEAAMAAGAAGLSCGLAYPTSVAASTAEVVVLARAAAQRGGRFCLHIRDEYDGVAPAVSEGFRIARESGAFLVLSHQKVAGVANQGRSRELLELYRREGEGLGYAIDAYPYTAGSTVLDPVSVAHSEKVLISWSQPHPEAGGRTLEAIARDWGCTQAEAIERLQPAGAVYFHMSQADVNRFLGFELCMVGSDGLPADQHPHPRLWGAFARFLGLYVHEWGLFTLEEAVRKMTSLPAAVFGLAERGRVAPGCFADLVLFDPAAVRDRATYEHPREPADGIRAVFVNGRQAWPEPGEAPGGRFLRLESKQGAAHA
jgi:N-acyl-D-amino-acid deacylase